MIKTLENRLSRRIVRMRSDVFLRGDFKDLGGYDQVGRALLRMVRQGRLLRIGFGLYARAVKTASSNEIALPKGLTTLREALGRLGIETVPTRLEQAYNAGRTTRVPTGRVVAVLRRVRRKLGYGGIALSFERARLATTRCRGASTHSLARRWSLTRNL